MYKKNPQKFKDNIEYITASVYFNIFSSEQIFKPINKATQNEKKYEYAPFHAVANYIRKEGYVGIIFRSTVHQMGTNLVLFDTEDTQVIEGSMEHINTDNYL